MEEQLTPFEQAQANAEMRFIMVTISGSIQYLVECVDVPNEEIDSERALNNIVEMANMLEEKYDINA